MGSGDGFSHDERFFEYQLFCFSSCIINLCPVIKILFL